MTPLDAPEPGFRDMPLVDVPAPPAPVRQTAGRRTASRRRLQGRFLRAGREAVDDRELLELLLSGRHAGGDAAALSASLLDIFGTAPRVLAARPDRLRTVPGLSEDGIAIIKTAEALGIRMARADVPQTVRPSFGNYSKVIDYCRTLAGHREVEEFHALYLGPEERPYRRRTASTRHRQPHAGLSPGDLRALSGASGQRDHRRTRSPSGDPEPSRRISR